MDLSPTDLDLATRTVLAEAGNQGPAGQAAVAAVIRNRQLTGRWGDTASQVVRAQNQFEPWNPGSGNNPRRFDPASPEYQRAATIVQGIYSGELPDPTGGATHFMAPSLQSALGRSTPSWARGTPLATIGGHQFFAPDGQVSPAQSRPHIEQRP